MSEQAIEDGGVGLPTSCGSRLLDPSPPGHASVDIVPQDSSSLHAIVVSDSFLRSAT
jgi:hypothetical protein